MPERTHFRVLVLVNDGKQTPFEQKITCFLCPISNLWVNVPEHGRTATEKNNQPRKKQQSICNQPHRHTRIPHQL